MSMNGIDIASYQTGINLTVVPCDFVIVKATQGVSYVNPDCDRAYQQAKNAGKKLGVYHYASGGGAVEEADFFIANVKGYLNEAILVLDWESGDNSAWSQGVAYAKAFLDRVLQVTGINPLIYMSKSVCNQYDWSSIAFRNGLWVAQYANYNRTGYQTNPWTDGTGYGAWSGPVIFQYSSSGNLNGWNGNLDINVAYIDKASWDKYAGKTGSNVAEAKPTQKSGEPYNDFGVWYRAYCETVGLLPAVRDGQVAGLTGYSKRLEGLMIDIDKIRERFGEQIKINVRLHLQGKGNVLYEDIKRDTYMGTKNESRRIEMIEIEIIGLPKEYVLEYDVHVKDKGWLGYALSGFGNGSAGMAIRIEAFRLRIRKIK